MLKKTNQYFFTYRRGSLLSTAIFVYAATAPVNGYSGGSLYARMGGKMWIRQVNIRENKYFRKNFFIRIYCI